MKTRLMGTAVACALLLAGCGTYYSVRDPSSGNTYYTTEIDSAGMSGAIKFKDVQSGALVTLQSSEVKQISKDEFNQVVVPAKK